MYQKLKYDNLFKNVIPNSVGGIKIFNVQDPYIISQKYDEVTNLENRIWSELFQNLEFELDRYASCLLYTSPSPRDKRQTRMPSSA